MATPTVAAPVPALVTKGMAHVEAALKAQPYRGEPGYADLKAVARAILEAVAAAPPTVTPAPASAPATPARPATASTVAPATPAAAPKT